MNYETIKILKLPGFQISLIIFLTFFIYFGVFKIPFVWDDEVQILGNQFVIKGGFLKEIFTTSVMTGGSAPGGASFYRPLVILFYRLEYIIFSPHPARFHLISLFFHFLNISLIYFLVRKISQKHFPKLPVCLSAFLASLLFALHPVNVEAISWIASQGDLIATSAILGAFLILFSLFHHIETAKERGGGWKYLIAVQVLFCLALFTKEPIIVFPIIFLIYLILFYPVRGKGPKTSVVLSLKEETPNGVYPIKKNISVYLKFVLTSAIPVSFYAIFRFLVAKIYFRSSLSLISEANFFQRFLTAVTSLGNYFKLLVFPSPLFTDRQFLITKLSDYRFIFSFLAIILLIFILLKIHRKKAIFSFFGLWFFTGILPGLNLFFPSGPAMAERYLYFPGIGLIFLIAFGLTYLFHPIRSNHALPGEGRDSAPMVRISNWVKKNSKTLKIIFIIILIINFVFWANIIIARNKIWQEPLKLYQHDAKFSPQSFLLQNNVGVEFYRQEKFEEAEKAFTKAIEIEPRYGIPYNNLGVILVQKGEIEKAIKNYKTAIELSNYYLAYINLSDIYLKEKNYQEGILLLERAVNFFPYNPQILSRLAYFYLQKGDFKESQRVAHQLLEIDPQNELAKTILSR